MNTTKNINPKIMEQYRLYCLQREQRLKAEAEERAQREARVSAQQEKYKPKIVVTRKPHVCSVCGMEIAKGERAAVKTVTTGFGWPEGYHRKTLYICAKCAEKEA